MRNNPVAPIKNFLPMEEVKKSFQVIKRILLRKFGEAKIRHVKTFFYFILNDAIQLYF